MPFPDAQFFWSKRVARFIQARFEVIDDDVLVTFGSPMSDHLVGLRLRPIFHNWVAHFSDPWSMNPFRKMWWPVRAVNRRIESAVLTKADRAFFTSPETVELTLSKFGFEYREKFDYFPHTFPQYLSEPKTETAQQRHDDFVIIRYVGSLYGRRGPDPLIKALRQIRRLSPVSFSRLRIQVIGPVSIRHRMTLRLFSRGLGLEVVGPVDQNAAATFMRTADILLSIDADSEMSPFFPSKLVEYFSFQKPIVAIVPAGTSERICREVGALTVRPRDYHRLADVLVGSCESLPSPPSKVETDRYLTKTVAKRFWDGVLGAASVPLSPESHGSDLLEDKGL